MSTKVFWEIFSSGKGYIACLISVAMIYAAGLRANDAIHAKTFAIAVPYQALIPSDYRQQFTKITHLEYSGLHWRQRVRIYGKGGVETYNENFENHTLAYSGDGEEQKSNTIAQVFKPYKTGSIFLAEHYIPSQSKPGKPSTIAVMIKREAGYDETSGNWEYAQWDFKGNLLVSGDSRSQPAKGSCFDCHVHMAERDFIFTTYSINEN